MRSEKYLFANWKMYLDYQQSLELAQSVVGAFANVNEQQIKMAVFPSALAFQSVAQLLKDAPVAVGAQNVYWVEKGGYTGEVSAHMYSALGAQYALVGHSERRHLCHESNHEVRQKVEAILSVGMVPVICVGETDKEKQENKTQEAIEAQVRAAFHGIVWPESRELVIAYEPVWAVGTGLACDPIEAEKTHEMIKKQVVALVGIEPIILYGGSVRADNVAEYLKNPNIDGVLVGGASAHLDSWSEIVEAAQ